MLSLANRQINDLQGLAHHIFNRQTSAYVFIFGRRESGKSDFALKLMPYTGIEVIASNIKILDDNKERIEYITDLQTLTRWANTTRGKKLYILDEAGKSMSKRQWHQRLNIDMINKLQILRKYKLSLILITPYMDWIDKGLLSPDLLDGYFRRYNKQSQDRAMYYDFYDNRIPPVYLDGITRTPIHFDSYDVAPFTDKPQNFKQLIKDKDLQILYDWSKGKPSKELGLRRMEIRRMLQEFVKNQIEGMSNSETRISERL